MAAVRFSSRSVAVASSPPMATLLSGLSSSRFSRLRGSTATCSTSRRTCARSWGRRARTRTCGYGARGSKPVPPGGAS
eukprot:12235955-Alexandrium_andersonii.AAC.1